MSGHVPKNTHFNQEQYIIKKLLVLVRSDSVQRILVLAKTDYGKKNTQGVSQE